MPDQSRFSIGTLEERIAAHCAHFDCAPVEIAYDDAGEPLLSDDLVDWCMEVGASIDWIVIGDPQGLSAAFKSHLSSLRRADECLQGFDEAEARMVFIAAKAALEFDASLESIFDKLKDEITTYRAKKKAA